MAVFGVFCTGYQLIYELRMAKHWKHCSFFIPWSMTLESLAKPNGLEREQKNILFFTKIFQHIFCSDARKTELNSEVSRPAAVATNSKNNRGTWRLRDSRFHTNYSVDSPIHTFISLCVLVCKRTYILWPKFNSIAQPFATIYLPFSKMFKV